MATPPQSTERPEPAQGLALPLPAIEFPMPNFRVPTREEERVIAQKNLVNARENMLYLGLHLVGVQSETIVPSSIKYVRSA